MAEILDEFPVRRGGRPEAYPWDEWFDGRIYKLTEGVDYSQTTMNFRPALFRKARHRGVKIRTSCGDGFIVVQAVES